MLNSFPGKWLEKGGGNIFDMNKGVKKLKIVLFCNSNYLFENTLAKVSKSMQQ